MPKPEAAATFVFESSMKAAEELFILARSKAKRNIVGSGLWAPASWDVIVPLILFKKLNSSLRRLIWELVVLVITQIL